MRLFQLGLLERMIPFPFILDRLEFNRRGKIYKFGVVLLLSLFCVLSITDEIRAQVTNPQVRTINLKTTEKSSTEFINNDAGRAARISQKGGRGIGLVDLNSKRPIVIDEKGQEDSFALFQNGATCVSNVETFEDETVGNTTFSEYSLDFNTTGALYVNEFPGNNFGCCPSTYYIDTYGNPLGMDGSAGSILLTTPATSFRVYSLDAWTSVSGGNVFQPGDVEFIGTLAAGGTVSTTLTVTPTSNEGTGYDHISFAGTPLDGALLTELEFVLAAPLEHIAIDNIELGKSTSPEIDVQRPAGVNNSIQDEGSDALGTTIVGAITLDYTIDNSNGTAQLEISDVSAMNPINISGFTPVTGLPLQVGAGSSATLQVQFNVNATGAFSFDLELTSNDEDECPYNIAVSGTGGSNTNVVVCLSNVETFEDEAFESTNFTEFGLSFSTTGVLDVMEWPGFNYGCCGSARYLDNSSSPTVGSVGSYMVTTPGGSFTVKSLYAWTSANGGTHHSSGNVEFIGTLAAGGTVSETIMINPTSDFGDGFDPISFAGTALDGAEITSLEFVLEAPLNDIAIDNIELGNANPPEIDVQRPAGVANSIMDGGSDALGTKPVGTTVVDYTIDNSGGASQLEVVGITAESLSNVNSVVANTLLPLQIPVGTSATLQIQFGVIAEGAFSFDLGIINTDENECPYNIAVSGTGGTSGTIEIIKDTNPDDAQDFAFSITGGLNPSTFNLDDDNDPTLSNKQTFSNVSPGSYTVTETAVTGYTTSISCNDPSGGTTTASPAATIDLAAGETVTCTFTNTKPQSDLSVTKIDSSDPVATGAALAYTLTVTNAGPDAAVGVKVEDVLPPGVSFVSAMGGGWSCNEAGGTVTCVRSVLAVGAMSAITVNVTAPVTGGVITNNVSVSSTIRPDPVPGNNSAMESTTVNAPPTFGKSFAPNPIASGETSTLTFTINNSASTAAAAALDFTDNLPAGVVVATPANASTTCTGGTLTATSGTGVISYTGGSVAAGSSCTVQVDVTSSTAGAHVNTSGDLTSSLGNSGTASTTLTVNAPPTFGKSFAPNPIASGETSTLTFTINNSASTSSATALDFTDNLPAGVVVATPSNASTTCTGGTLTATSGTGIISYTGGSVAAGSSCTVQVDVTSSTAGSHVNTSGDLTSSLGNSGKASATLTVNPIPGTIEIIKDTNPDAAQDFTFSITGGLNPSSFNLDDDADNTLSNKQTFSNVVPGSYTVTETAVNGYNTTISCVDPSGGTTTASLSATIDLAEGETVTCTFLNTEQGTIEIIKDTNPDDAQDFAFSTTGGLVPSTFNLDDDADNTLSNQQTFQNVAPGSYTVTETAVNGYNTTVSCVDPSGGTTTASPAATIDLAAGETVTCTFTNTKQGTIEIIKDTNPDDAQDFAFSTTGGLNPSTFNLDDDADNTLSNQQTFHNVAPGSYTVTETAVNGYNTTVSCVDPSGGTTTASPAATIDLAAGETVTCTFTNTKQGTIEIIKDTNPDDAQDFAFSTTGGLNPSTFNLDDDADNTLSNQQTFHNVAPGSYTVTETAVNGYNTTVSCVDPSGGTTTASPAATIDLAAGETVTCTFTNTKQGTIEIIKDTNPDDAQDFAFSITGGLNPSSFSLDDDADNTLSNKQTFSNVAPGSYTVTETAVNGYNTTISCVDPSGGTTTASPAATIDLAAGETVTCTFTNIKLGTINIIKDAVPDDAQDFVYTHDIERSGPFSLDDDADLTLSNTKTFTNVTPASVYTVTETPVTGFVTTVACVDSDGSGTASTTLNNVATINLDYGETVTCTFTNTKLVNESIIVPETDTNQVGTQHLVTVTIKQNNVVQQGVAVTFDVFKGPNQGVTGTTSGPTDASGQATFTYTGGNTTGTDSIKASGTVNGVPFECFAEKVWVENQCTLTPATDQNQVGHDHTVTVTLTQNGNPIQGVTVNFDVFKGPNSGDNGIGTTDASGQETFTYTGDGGVGVDSIRASGTINGVPFECLVEKNWVESQNLNDFIGVEDRFPFYNTGTHQFSFDVRIQNTTTEAFVLPLFVRFVTLQSIPAGHSISIDNPDGGGNGVGSYYDYSGLMGPDNRLDPGEFTEYKTWIINDPDDVLIDMFADVLGVLEAPPLAKSGGSENSIRFIIDVLNEKVTIIIGPTVTDVEDMVPVEIPSEFTLQQNYPNPFNPETTIQFGLPQASEVTINIYNLQGQLVRRLMGEQMQAGNHEIIWDARDELGNSMPSGVYLYRIKAGGFIEVRKLMLIR